MCVEIFLQLLTKRVQDITQSMEEQAVVQNFFTKVHTVVQNMILTGDGEELVSMFLVGGGGEREGGSEEVH